MGSFDLSHASSFKGGSETFLRNVFENILKTYLKKEPNSEDHMGGCSVSGQREDLLRSLHFPDV
ncbi:unnamed protein product [Brassica oleracea]